MFTLFLIKFNKSTVIKQVIHHFCTNATKTFSFNSFHSNHIVTVTNNKTIKLFHRFCVLPWLRILNLDSLIESTIIRCSTIELFLECFDASCRLLQDVYPPGDTLMKNVLKFKVCAISRTCIINWLWWISFNT